MTTDNYPNYTEPQQFKQDKVKNKPLFACIECGKKFYSTKAAEKAAFGDNGCPSCGASDIDIYLERDAQ